MLHLEKGILLEDKNVMLEWGHSIKELAARNGAEVDQSGDRTVINWGVHTILGGLQLGLTNTYLGHTGPQFNEEFKSIASWAYGDNKSFEGFERISKHLLDKIGEPTEKKDRMETDSDKEWIWRGKEVIISLYLFEQHAFKLVFTIERVE